MVVITYFVIINRNNIIFVSGFCNSSAVNLGMPVFKGKKKGILSFALILDYNVVVMLLDFAFPFDNQLS